MYSSRPFGYDQSTLDGILLDARRCNTRDDITGALVCRHDVFVQMLEGPRERVSDTFHRIRQDDRHSEVKLRYFGDSPNRMFEKWAMLHDPARSWLWSIAEVDQDALEKASVTDYRRIFRILAENMEAAERDGK
ncbi:MAG: BLUF domain-containing protein [Pseudomonadota bacterium]